MLSNLSSTNLVIIGLVAILIYAFVVAVAMNKSLFPLAGRPVVHADNLAPDRQFTQMPSPIPHDLLPPLLDKPASHPIEQAGYFETEEDESGWEMVDDDQNTLLKEAERVVEDIQEVVNHIASYPANPDEVCSKIHAIVSQYGFFMDTEYYDAINSFIAVTVQRDCELALTADDIQALWYAAAA
jgi:hypothetical protein